MSLARIYSVALSGLEAHLIEVEVDVTLWEKFTLVIVGLPDAAVRESKDRVIAAIKNSKFKIDNYYCTVNLAPGDLKKEGALYDLPIALGLLQAMKCGPDLPLHSDYLIIGELGLSGETRPIHGALAISILARQLGKRGIILPAQNASEAAAIPGIEVIPVTCLKQAVEFFINPASIKPFTNINASVTSPNNLSTIDFLDIKGQQHVKRALEIAAAGGHNVILSGPPGSGKSMLAKAMVGIMPSLTLEEAIEVTKIHSIAGLLPTGKSLLSERPFRSPHHTVSYAGLIGGGANPRPGEVALSHQGILFLDELPEFSRQVLEVLRQPLEDRKVTISRANGTFTFPTDFICIGAMNPCPCGYLGHPEKSCKDTPQQIERYQNKISGPLLDRIDMHIEVPALKYRDMASSVIGDSSKAVRERVEAARTIQHKRHGRVHINSQLSSRDLKIYCTLDEACKELIKYSMDELGFSARAADRLQRVSRTIADLEGIDTIQDRHLMEAINFRGRNKESNRG